MNPKNMIVDVGGKESKMEPQVGRFTLGGKRKGGDRRKPWDPGSGDTQKKPIMQERKGQFEKKIKTTGEDGGGGGGKGAQVDKFWKKKNVEM